MKLYHVHRENKYDDLFKEGNIIEFGKQDNFLKETLFVPEENCNFRQYWINVKEAINKKDEIRKR